MAAKKYFYAVWRRKCSTAVIKLFPKGTGNVQVKKGENLVSLKDFFGWHDYLLEDALMPFSILGNKADKSFDIEVVMRWGGIMGQAEALRLGLARALVLYNEEYRLTLKPHGLLKRDPRIKERKKPGLKKARKSAQWSKR